MKFYIKFLFILLLPVGCNRSNIVYPKTIEVTETVRLGRQVMNEDFIFSFPTDMFIEDSLIIVHDSYAQEQCFHILQAFQLRGHPHRHDGRDHRLGVVTASRQYDRDPEKCDLVIHAEYRADGVHP